MGGNMRTLKLGRCLILTSLRLARDETNEHETLVTPNPTKGRSVLA